MAAFEEFQKRNVHQALKRPYRKISEQKNDSESANETATHTMSFTLTRSTLRFHLWEFAKFAEDLLDGKLNKKLIPILHCGVDTARHPDKGND